MLVCKEYKVSRGKHEICLLTCWFKVQALVPAKSIKKNVCKEPREGFGMGGKTQRTWPHEILGFGLKFCFAGPLTVFLVLVEDQQQSTSGRGPVKVEALESQV